MKLESTFLRSKVARRVLLLFVLAAFIPFLVLSVLYFVESNRSLVRQGHIRLQTAGASYGRTIYDRLLLADQLLRSTAGDLNSDSARAAARKRMGKTFRSLTLISPQNRVVPVFGDTADVTPLGEAAAARLRQGGSVLTSPEASDRGGRIVLVQALTPVAAELRLVAAEIDAGYLWGDPETFPYATSFCVLNDAYAGLYCPPPFQPEAIGMLIRGFPQSTKGEFTWRDGQEKFLADFSEHDIQRDLLGQCRPFRPAGRALEPDPDPAHPGSAGATDRGHSPPGKPGFYRQSGTGSRRRIRRARRIV
jgi:hypothetical protein